jgi:hypothetical protein
VIARAAAVVVAAVALAAACYRLPGLVRAGHQYLSGPSYSLGYSDIDPLHYFASVEALQLARARIPAGDTYTVVIGDDPPLQVDSPQALPSIFRFWLLPRRYTRYLSRAQWVITYHRSSETVGVRYRREIGLGPDANLLEVER